MDKDILVAVIAFVGLVVVHSFLPW